MKTLIALLCLLSLPAAGQAVNNYKPNGQLESRGRQEGNRWVESKPNGQDTGYWRKEGSDWVHHDVTGKVTGRSRMIAPK